MNRKIVYKVKERKRTHRTDPRIEIEETVLELVKTMGFNFIGEKQEQHAPGPVGYIWSTYIMIHHQMNKKTGDFLDSWAHKNDEKEDYEKRVEDFKKLMKNIDVPDDDIKGPYDRDENGKKLIGDVREHWHSEEIMGRREFTRLCGAAESIDCLIEIQYPAT
tara:strand:+ start:303 stop:788 length:486 start_codon:yes stop_codon:yes gene_type:complete